MVYLQLPLSQTNCGNMSFGSSVETFENSKYSLDGGKKMYAKCIDYFVYC